ncbi:MAG TPA: hypothetical protein VFQ53_27570 [Kofleriaceae bacterium]|nr:hypothetical protein [Kofleriaceae bacterium]
MSAVCLLGATVAHAGPYSLVPTAAEPNNSVDLHLRLDYEYQVDTANVMREVLGTEQPLDPIKLNRDLTFHQVRHLLTPTAELGLYHDSWLSFALPIVVSQSRELELDGIDRGDSTTLINGLLPMTGFDARDPGTMPPGGLVFRGITRKGLDQIHAGLNVAPMNQARDPSKPTWKMGAEVRLAIGKIMKFDPMQPGAETGVGRGVHELRLWTSFARRLSRVEGWTEVFWQVPLHAKPDSLFTDPGFGSTNTGLGQQAGVKMGLELFALDDAANNNRIGIDLGAKAIAHFEGRDYSEMWEVFAFAGDSRGTGPLVLDADPTDPGLQALSHPGISNIENYLETGAHLAVQAELGTFVRFGASFDLVWKTDHVISFADAGVDLPTCAQGVGACEDDDNDLVNPGTPEVNPLHVPRIDLVGHRYHSVDNFGVVVGVMGQLLF